MHSDYSNRKDTIYTDLYSNECPEYLNFRCIHCGKWTARNHLCSLWSVWLHYSRCLHKHLHSDANSSISYSRPHNWKWDRNFGISILLDPSQSNSACNIFGYWLGSYYKCHQPMCISNCYGRFARLSKLHSRSCWSDDRRSLIHNYAFKLRRLILVIH
jgi:hypothetical protein